MTRITYLDPNDDAPKIEWQGVAFRAMVPLEVDDIAHAELVADAAKHPYFRVEGRDTLAAMAGPGSQSGPGGPKAAAAREIDMPVGQIEAIVARVLADLLPQMIEEALANRTTDPSGAHSMVGSQAVARAPARVRKKRKRNRSAAPKPVPPPGGLDDGTQPPP